MPGDGWGLRAAVTERLGPNPHLRVVAGARRRVRRSTIDRTTVEVLATIDVEGFHRRFRDDPEQQALAGRGSSKYIHLERWLRVAVERWYAYGFDRLPAGSRLLDIGCGSGFFLLVARHMGHEAVGLDLDIDPLYDAQMEFFGLERMTHLITPDDPLPFVGRSFDVVTAFMMCFHWDLHTGEPWSADDWARFLPSLRAAVADGGRVLLWLNRNNVTGEYLGTDVRATILADPSFTTRPFANCLDLRPVPGMASTTDTGTAGTVPGSLGGAGHPAGPAPGPRRHLLDDRATFVRMVSQPTAVVPKDELLVSLARGRSVLDVGCIDHSADTALGLGEAWPHRRLQAVATEVVGLDLLADDAARLNELGCDIRVGDAEDFDLGRTFDLVVAGDLIEHLGNPAGFLASAARHMHGDSRAVVTTPNPFNAEQLAWAAVRGRVLVNEQHTLWLDPRVAHELVARSPLEVVGFHWIDTRFALPLFGPGPVPRLVNGAARRLMARRPVMRRDFALVLARRDRP